MALSDRARAVREDRIRELREQGWSLRAIGTRVKLSAERVRRILADAPPVIPEGDAF